MYTQAAAQALAAASAAYGTALAATQSVYDQLRDPAQPWQQTVMRLLDSHAALMAAADGFETAAWNLRNPQPARFGRDPQRGDLTTDDVDLMLREVGPHRSWSRHSDGDTRAEAEQLIQRHVQRLARVAEFTAAR